MPDQTEAMKWYKEAAVLGNEDAQYKMGRYYDESAFLKQYGITSGQFRRAKRFLSSAGDMKSMGFEATEIKEWSSVIETVRIAFEQPDAISAQARFVCNAIVTIDNELDVKDRAAQRYHIDVNSDRDERYSTIYRLFDREINDGLNVVRNTFKTISKSLARNGGDIMHMDSQQLGRHVMDMRAEEQGLRQAMSDPSTTPAQRKLLSKQADHLAGYMRSISKQAADFNYERGRKLREVKSVASDHRYDSCRKDLGDASADYSTAIQWYKKAAEQGHLQSQDRLGDIYFYGKGVDQDYSEATEWYKKAADQGSNNARNNLIKIDRRRVQAQSQADEGANARNNYVKTNPDSMGTSQCNSGAVKWYEDAAVQGDADAQFNLGSMYQNCRGAPQSDTEAIKWFRKADEKGNEETQNSLISTKNRLIGNQTSSSNEPKVSKTIENQNNDENSTKSNAFARIFDVIPYESFEHNPRIILSYMMDFGFRRVEVRLLETVLSCDSRGFIDLLSCPEEDVDSNINSIADYCLVDSAAFTELVIGMRSAIKGRRR